jgi:HSP20 family protein
MAKQETQVQKRESTDMEVAERTRSGKVFAPPIDIIDSKNELKLYADMPGVNKDSINISLEQGVLTIRGNVDTSAYEKYELLYQEYEIGDFQRSFTLTDDIDQDKIEAVYDNGVLELTLAKAEKAKPRKIAVKSV